MSLPDVKIGNFVIYRTYTNPAFSDIGVVLYLNREGGTLKVLNTRGKISWFVWSGCEVINEI